jgi:hypothetical protein
LIWYQIILKDQAGREQQQRKENFRDVSRMVDPQFWQGLRERADPELVNTFLECREDVGQSWSVLKKSVVSVMREEKSKSEEEGQGDWTDRRGQD